MRILAACKRALDTGAASVICVLLAIAARAGQSIYFMTFTGDRAAQIEATHNFLNGHGFSVKEALLTDLSQSHYSLLIKWPPGYSVLLAPFYTLTGNNIFLSTAILDILVAIAFVLVARRLIRQLDVPRYATNLYTLVAGFFLYSFTCESTTDVVCQLFFMIAVSCSLNFFRGFRPMLNAALITFFLFGAATTRYLFIPVALAYPLYFLVAGFVNRKAAVIRTGAAMLVILIVLIGGLLTWQSKAGGAATYYLASEKGFFPENLRSFNPFILYTFINPDPTLVTLERATPLSYAQGLGVFSLVNAILLPALLILVMTWLWKKRFRNPDQADHYYYLNLVGSGATIATLVYLSVTNAYFVDPPAPPWTFVQQTRYYSIPIFALQQTVFVLLFSPKSGRVAKWARNTAKIAFGLLLIFSLHAVYFTIGLPFKRPHLYSGNELDLIKFERPLLKKIIAANPGLPVVASSDNFLFNSYTAVYEGIPSIEDYHVLNMDTLPVSKPILLFVTLLDKTAFRARGFLANPATIQVGRIHNFSIYTRIVYPTQR